VRFTLTPGRWYAMELISPEFGPAVRRCSPVRVDGFRPAGDGSGSFELSFFHAAYPEGVQSKLYNIYTLERQEHYLLGREAGQKRLVLFLELTDEWLEKNFDRQALKNFQRMRTEE